MKIAYYIGSLNRGGTETLILDVCHQHRIAPYQMILFHRKGGDLLQDVSATGVPIKQIAGGKNWLRHIYLLRQSLRQEQVDIVHAQTPLCALIAAISTIGSRTQVITTLHGFELLSDSHLMQKAVFRLSNKLIFVSEETQRTYLERCKSIDATKCHVVYNGICFDRIATKQPSTSPSLITKLCMVGSFRSGRNQLFVCHFLKKLHDQGIPFHFSFIGARCKGEEQCYDQCVDYCQQNGMAGKVEFLGARNDVPQLLLQMDAYIYASDHDTFGISIAEAIAAGLPTFVNDWPVANEITHHGEWAHIYRSNDTEHLFQQFLHLIQHREEEAQQAHHNAHEIRNHFSITQHIQRLNSVYLMVISKQ